MDRLTDRWALVCVRAGVQRRAVADQLGASAKVVVFAMAERAGRRISFWRFTRTSW